MSRPPATATTGCWPLHVQPGAKQTAAVGEQGGRLKLKIAAPPVDNKANVHLLDWLAAQLGVPKASVP